LDLIIFRILLPLNKNSLGKIENI